ncbi:MAG: hypothetical protein AB7O96_06070 [Pseudobdellovibrionaceae bacterium]
MLILFLSLASLASSPNCGPVSPGGTTDPECNPQTAPPPSSYLQETKNLVELLASAQIYFMGSSPDSLKWSGEIYWYGNGSCFKSNEKSEMSGKADIKTADCSKEIKDRANFKYTSIGTSKEIKAKFIACLMGRDIHCLRSLTDKNIQVSFGVEPPGDQAFLMYSKWKEADFKKMQSLLEQGMSCTSEDRCEFPKKVSDGGLGLRGAFEKSAERWLLKSYLGGD